ncbi:MAG: betaine--homocysteine S-methyltransferase [Anaerolineales bacterium]
MAKNQIKEWLDAGETILLDGAMGTVLIEAGLEPGAPPELWNSTHPDRIREIHRSYIGAGAQVILTNSFGGSPIRLAMHQLEDRVVELNQAAASLARMEADAAGRPVVVAGSIGPTGALLAPLGPATFEQMKDGFAKQAGALAAGGAEVIWIETMSDLGEVKAAVEGAHTTCDLPVVATMTFDTNGHTMMGVGPEQAVDALAAMDLLAIGANCGNGPGEIEHVVQVMRSRAPGLAIVAKSNAGIPKMVEGDVVYDGTPSVMAEHVQTVNQLGANLIGGCCGNSPDHIRAMAEALRADRPR